tara:strand:+ start:387 stop:620 length:234 start_codon:yes stop_codon:yes gene_type:complete
MSESAFEKMSKALALAEAENKRLHKEDADNRLAAYIDGLRAYAWWKDGTEYVGCGNYTLEQAIARAMEESIRLWRRL